MLRIFGIRHHGPGSSRALAAVLDAWEPDCLLVEGPPDADAVIPFVAEAGLVPPVAILVHAADDPKRAVFFPLARFSPEWNALRWAVARGIRVRFCDLPQMFQLLAPIPVEAPPDDTAVTPDDDEGVGREEGDVEALSPELDPVDLEPLRRDPLGMLSLAAGYDERDGWWDAQIESRRDPSGIFDAVLELMRALRAEAPPTVGREARREAWMRRTIREAQKAGHERIAVVCGAWHAPALEELARVPGKAGASVPSYLVGISKKSDDELLKGLPKVKVSATWVPWTNKRLAVETGYGAGVSSPAWYGHLWDSPDRATIRWVSEAARLLRGQDLDASSASVIEAVRLAEALAGLRGRPAVGLGELQEAVRSVLCRGDDAPMALVRATLVVGHALGAVPASVPTLPIQRDLEARQRAARLKPALAEALTAETRIEVDLREPGGRARSRLLHQLGVLDIPWGEREKVTNSAGNFREAWVLEWDPEFAVRLVEASIWGATVEGAAEARLVNDAESADALDVVAPMLDDALLAELDGAIEPVLRRIQALSAASTDVVYLADALPPLAQVSRYGDVRGTKVDAVVPIFDGLVERVLIGLPLACQGIDAATATSRTAAMKKIGDAIATAARPGQREEWLALVLSLAEAESGHPLVRGYASRLSVDARMLADEALERVARRNLSHAVEPADAASWIEGLLLGGATLLLHQDELWRVLDSWIAGLPAEPDGDAFTALLPVLRRAFSTFSGPERARMGQKLKAFGGPARIVTATVVELHPERSRAVLPVLRSILGVS
ncbi:MAG: DUF5682 family protein [Pseudomonadota bacterium]|nr:DUF5682 family protein [Pseudomonadota bacterium]